MAMSRPQVMLVVEERLVHYRVPLYAAMAKSSKEYGWAVHFRFGEVDSEATRAAATHAGIPFTVDGALKFRIAGRLILFQRCPTRLGGVHLVVMSDHMGSLLNYFVRFQCRRRRIPYVLFGHGQNRSRKSSQFVEGVKRMVIRRASGYLAYTPEVARFVIALGVKPCRVCSVNNSTDTKLLRQLRAAITEQERTDFRKALDVASGPIVLVLGRIYRDKNPQLLLHTIREALTRLSDLTFVVAGTEVDTNIVSEFATREPRVRMVGHLEGRDLALAGSLSAAILAPSGVGLVATDSFALECPIVTTLTGHLGPEIEYLIDGTNAVIVENAGPRALSDALIELLRDDARLALLREGCRSSVELYSVEAMATTWLSHCRSLLDRDA